MGCAPPPPLIAFYGDKGTLRTVDGMAEIDDVAKAIEQVLAEQEQAGARARVAR